MTRHTSHRSSGTGDEAFDLSQIFIGREQQLDLFAIYLARWKNLLFDADPDLDPRAMFPPSPNNKLQGLIVLLYGRGGFGKSTLLRRYRNRVLEENQNLIPGQSAVTTSEVVDWEFAIEGKRGLFSPPPGQDVDASDYFRVLWGQLAIVLGKPPKAFKEYQAAVRDVEEARKKASGVLDTLKSDDRYAALRDMTVDGLMTAVSTVAPAPVGKILGSDKVKGAASQGVKVAGEVLAQIRRRLHDRLGEQFGDFLEPALRLGLALGRDLRAFAQDFPLLIFFDTYEEIDEGDQFLRIVMGAAGLRVGWVLAGRDNLWAGPGQTERSRALEYSYKEVIPSDRGLAIDFNVGGVGAFTLSDIKDYFDLLCKRARHHPHLPKVTEDGAKRILDVTRGVPLAVKIAAGLYMDTANLDTLTDTVEGKREIVDQMVRRYLLHARDYEDERAKLYGLAMLRRADQPLAVAAALSLTTEEAEVSYTRELSRLHRRYSFIFTEREEPALHQEVRHFLRLWLLEHRKDPEVVAVNRRLKEAHEVALKTLEERMHYITLQERLQDEEWIGIYLDLTEQQFWLNLVEGVHSLLPFMIAAAIYHRDINEDVAALGTFFAAGVRSPYRNWWTWATQSLVYTTSRNSSPEALAGLEEMEKLAHDRCPTFPPPLPDYRRELEAALWWRLGEAYVSTDATEALAWYEKALTRLGQQSELKEAAARAAWNVAHTLYKEKKHAEQIPLLNKAIELNPSYVTAYAYRGLAYWNLKDSQRAIQDYDRAIELNPSNVAAYGNRGLAYRDLKDSRRAIQDFDRVIELDPNDARAYRDRGTTYLWPKNITQAVADYSRCYELDPVDINTAWMCEWAGMSKQQVDLETATRLEALAATYPQQHLAHVCQGVALGLRGKVKEGLGEVERAIPLAPEEWDAYFWKGMLSAYYFRGLPRAEEARALTEQALTMGLPPVLLTPLYWLEKDNPSFFEQYARPLLEEYDV